MKTMEQPNLNTRTPWSELADRDLRWCLEKNQALDSIADFLCRTETEVRDRMEQLGLQEPPGFI